MFDKRHFPCKYECENCSEVATVTHEDVQGVPSLTTFSAAEAVEYVMEHRRGWSLGTFGGARCPGCTDMEA
ncbi:hypothetical protein [Salinibacter altiplanensis]|uniref:hypothetical protein n=1 Tax=Salinibacter altiplanensis TaxID=1803181 RepID=UPI000C9F98E1|nr:hypothetical protein [Salinibacter altiplanensis]